MKTLINLIFLLSAIISASAQPTIDWQKSFGGSYNEIANSVQQTFDGGYIIAGYTNSVDGDVVGNHGSRDFWVLKLNSLGVIDWQKTLGGSNVDEAYSIVQTKDTGYIVCGSTISNDGDVTGNHGGVDMWVVKLTKSGNLDWQKTLGGSVTEAAKSIIQTSDGGYMVAGYTNSNDGDVTGLRGYNDYWIVKLSKTGMITWQKTYGGYLSEELSTIRQTFDGGYIIAGSSNSNSLEVSGNHGSVDYWVVKTNDTGRIEWQKSLGGSKIDKSTSIVQTADSGYIVAGYSSSNDGDVSGNHGNLDYWVVKLNDTGRINWQKSLGGSQGDQASSIHQTRKGTYIIAGSTLSNDGDVVGSIGNVDYWIIKLNTLGAIDWQKTYGGTAGDYPESIKQTADGGFITAGHSGSNDVDVSGNHGATDYWILKLAPDCDIDTNVTTTGTTIKSVENPLFSTFQWIDCVTKLPIAGATSQSFTPIKSGTYAVIITQGICIDTSICTKFVPASIVENSKSTLNIYPNPAKETICVAYSSSESGNISISNTLGQTIESIDIAAGNHTQTIAINELANGIYILKMTNKEGEVIVQKFVKY